MNQPRPPLVRIAVVAAAVALLGAWAFGFARWVSASDDIDVRLPRLEPPPADEHDLAALRFGPTLRASSYERDPFLQHHPAFLVDQRLQPTLVEKWQSEAGDAQPFVEVRWREPRQLERVVLRHAGDVEDPELTLDRYTLTCLRDDARPGATITVEHNRAALAIHPLPCAGARGIRLEARPRRPGVVRLYELEAWGR